MTRAQFEQRNPYKGTPPRPWIIVSLGTRNGERHDLPLLADTGSPFSVVLSSAWMARVMWDAVAGSNSNFGLLEGGWVHVAMPELGLDQHLIGYASNAVATAAKRSDPDFEGIVGLPFLRLLEFGGDPDWFWLRSLTATNT